jgi:predicted HAD superfamily Cof-like phosphohydrolase
MKRNNNKEIKMNDKIQGCIDFCDQEIASLVNICNTSDNVASIQVHMGMITAYTSIKERLQENNNKEIKMSIFKDQETFMVASDQTVDKFNEAQYNLYLNLIREEFNELSVAESNNDLVEVTDAILDMIVVGVGALLSAGVDVEGAWNEVIRSNMSKIDPDTGKVLKREDGKVLKPISWSPPNLKPFLVR